ncbi:MAG: Na/Pi cotransporter family protein [Clostridiales bacterium]|nr:Na/Pi cotransporter family protein [Clostridiales bacterium]
MGFDNYLEMVAGLALFLFGMNMMSQNLEKTAGSGLRKLLQALTKNKFLGLLVGALFTMVIQSSSATTVMTVGLVNAGLMNLSQSVGVIFGANIGTTITAQLIAFKLTKIAPILLLIGIGMMLFQKKKSVRGIGAVVLGFGLLFFGLNTMSNSMAPLRTMVEFQQLMVQFKSPIIGMLIGMAMTAVIQSSSASVGILQALAMQELVGIDTAVFIILGTNIGTCVTAMLASIGTSKNARRVALIHLLFNVLGAFIMIGLVSIFPVTTWMKALSPGSVVRQIANTHMLFKIVETVIFLPMSGLLVKIVRKIIPGEDPVREPEKLMYVEDHLFATPTIVVAQLIMEVNRMGKIVEKSIKNAVQAFVKKDQDLVDDVLSDERVTDYLNHEITRYLVKANQLELSAKDALLVGAMYHVVNDLERIGDHAENIAEFAQARIDSKNLRFSKKAIVELEDISEKCNNLLVLANNIFKDSDKDRANVEIAPLEQEIDDLEKELRKKHIKRLSSEKCTPRSGTIFIEILSNLERVADHSTNVAYSVLEDG